jgi:hypothetical protein
MGYHLKKYECKVNEINKSENFTQAIFDISFENFDNYKFIDNFETELSY